MNKRLKELVEQAGLQKYFLGSGYIVRDQDLERFADLVRQDEREACAKLCDKWSASFDEGEYMAKAIRARGVK